MVHLKTSEVTCSATSNIGQLYKRPTNGYIFSVLALRTVRFNIISRGYTLKAYANFGKSGMLIISEYSGYGTSTFFINKNSARSIFCFTLLISLNISLFNEESPG